MRKATRPFLVEIGRKIATLPRRPPNQTTLPRAGRLSRLTFRKTSCVLPTKLPSAFADFIGSGKPNLGHSFFWRPPSPAPTGRILRCLLPEPPLDQASDNPGSVRSKRRKQAVKQTAAIDAGLKGRR